MTDKKMELVNGVALAGGKDETQIIAILQSCNQWVVGATAAAVKWNDGFYFSIIPNHCYPL